jgi:hypothetical protein
MLGEMFDANDGGPIEHDVTPPLTGLPPGQS